MTANDLVLRLFPSSKGQPRSASDRAKTECSPSVRLVSSPAEPLHPQPTRRVWSDSQRFAASNLKFGAVLTAGQPSNFQPISTRTLPSNGRFLLFLQAPHRPYLTTVEAFRKGCSGRAFTPYSCQEEGHSMDRPRIDCWPREESIGASFWSGRFYRKGYIPPAGTAAFCGRSDAGESPQRS